MTTEEKFDLLDSKGVYVSVVAESVNNEGVHEIVWMCYVIYNNIKTHKKPYSFKQSGFKSRKEAQDKGFEVAFTSLYSLNETQL